ncbi:MAG: hypothetical protein COT74_09905 [Bdellovibrionales bacterium CG10_big_fil_rev_8_21_14_0_10_45_34]|nr:MAG: hypothetical protein COT74_09905 [Bdellovibrionales bacterium CG10_big_fil_rev_8_21_14_0_10_45_34]
MKAGHSYNSRESETNTSPFLNSYKSNLRGFIGCYVAILKVKSLQAFAARSYRKELINCQKSARN